MLLRISPISLLAVFVCAFLSFAPQAVQAQEAIKLYRAPGKAVRNYDSLISQMIKHFETEGAKSLWVEFSGDYKVLVKHIAGYGEQNVILEIADEVYRVRRVRLRLFAPWLMFIPGKIGALIDSLEIFRQAHNFLSKLGIDIPFLETLAGHEGEFLKLEKIKYDFNYGSYLDRDFVRSLTIGELIEIDRDFLKFVATTAKLQRLGDFHSGQLVYKRGRGWVLLDFTTDSEFALDGGTENIFERNARDAAINYARTSGLEHFKELILKPGLPAHIRERALQIIQDVRSGKPLPPSEIDDVPEVHERDFELPGLCNGPLTGSQKLPAVEYIQ
jgi:hypothetical protein